MPNTSSDCPPECVCVLFERERQQMEWLASQVARFGEDEFNRGMDDLVDQVLEEFKRER